MGANFVFLHGGGQGSWVWDETIGALARQGEGDSTRILALDIPGCGRKRDRVTDDIDVASIVAELVSDIEAAGFQDIVLVGHSQAGTILPLLVNERPALFRHAVYVSCLAPTGAQTSLNWREDMEDDGSALPRKPSAMSREDFRAAFCNDMAFREAEDFLDKLGKDQWPRSSYQMSGWRYAHLDALPASYVMCLQDAALVPSWQEMFAERLRAKSIIRVDAGHQVMNSRPHTLAEILRHEAER